MVLCREIIIRSLEGSSTGDREGTLKILLEDILRCQFDLFVWFVLVLSGNNSPRVKFRENLHLR